MIEDKVKIMPIEIIPCRLIDDRIEVRNTCVPKFISSREEDPYTPEFIRYLIREHKREALEKEIEYLVENDPELKVMADARYLTTYSVF
jgi:hypothetical protein